jgi:hypothetical protein
MKADGTAVLKKAATNSGRLRNGAIAEYHELLAADKTLSPGALDKLREAMRASRLTYGDRLIGVALRPHLLERKQFDRLTAAAELIAHVLERIAAAAVQSSAVTPSTMKRIPWCAPTRIIMFVW